ncbi:MAG TPA: T9SS type A sorting domain-containing protein, partial [Bacteroidia bacterium]|nr:T9SS type A sorting domain-containing protein [Bacteroidia bacterium]
TITQTVTNCTTDIDQLTNSNNYIMIYPNPGKGIFYITIDSETKQTQIEVYNILGECILRQTTTVSNSQIDLSSQPVGVYFINVKMENKYYTRKVIKS